MTQKNDHGNEETISVSHGTGEKRLEYVDHTLPPKLKLKILTDPTPEGLIQKYNDFPHPIKFSQDQLAPSLYTIAVYFEEVEK